ncbi:MAG: Lrp/AsnC family transcriptional regulator [Methanocalculus sp. MSAO_Arc1]|uniref:Lrp/AsnC family transcriptional regulator n=1 Tax=Methanocalculus TaxID=71151 RepID=UPI000FF1D793|nr:MULTISPECIES: Lrp/AsnC family transcriptional regulator [unclassified Methanocalculus]MCP1662822.1 DNA-binding Lrp family transcriptional regulator [Methanocalculus sp. AMF5]RQD79012.1 MAG: Lrp/AsnC family transcriptional regulator [Methanocalculus sp. MSAO_Arc1]
MTGDLFDEALRMIQSKSEGVLQSELWKLLDVDSRKCSRIVKKLVDSGLVDRQEYRKNGIKTFILKSTKKRVIDPDLLMAGDHLVPCVGCERECVVWTCDLLLDWMYELAVSDFEE